MGVIQDERNTFCWVLYETWQYFRGAVKVWQVKTSEKMFKHEIKHLKLERLMIACQICMEKVGQEKKVDLFERECQTERRIGLVFIHIFFKWL